MNKLSTVLSVFRLLKGCMEADVEGSSFFTDDFQVDRGPPLAASMIVAPTRGVHAMYCGGLHWATWQHKKIGGALTILINGWWEVWRRISTLVIWSDQHPQICLKHHWWNASIPSPPYAVEIPHDSSGHTKPYGDFRVVATWCADQGAEIDECHHSFDLLSRDYEIHTGKSHFLTTKLTSHAIILNTKYNSSNNSDDNNNINN